MKKMIVALTMAGTIFSMPIVSNAALGDQTLKIGMTHQDVKELKEALKEKGYFTSPTITTYFNSETKAAVMKFQKAHGISADGIVGKHTLQLLGTTNKNNIPTSTANVDKLIIEAKKHMNVPYVWGGSTPKGFDCSGFLNYAFEKGIGVDLPRTVADIYKKGQKVSKPAIGDLVFFETYKPGASHAGIYLGNNQFIHSSSSKGVSVSSMNNSYWSKRYLGAKSY
ncbi:endopeptidase [Bacillus sp. FJAT-27231]|uniref:C40 family peptidase n=1 Tax=Bacillus sp. FJAT-27231 TaxID=1679168 RepID=UPI00067143D4|nr:NlpC/P60 family protein [Bacillus sp. FJAT-27231]KMY52530.1 endopeptidase [Bacillus sp. FJAT-27231]